MKKLTIVVLAASLAFASLAAGSTQYEYLQHQHSIMQKLTTLFDMLTATVQQIKNEEILLAECPRVLNAYSQALSSLETQWREEEPPSNLVQYHNTIT